MPTLPPLPDGIRVVMKFTCASQQVRNVYHVRSDVAIDEPLLTTAAEIFKNAWIDRLQPFQSQLLTLDAIDVTDISVIGGIGIEYAEGLPIQANTTLGGLPNNATVASKLTTGHVGRSYRGRSFLCGLAELYVSTDKQHITSALQAQISLFYADLLENLPLNGLHLAIASFYSGVDSDGKPIPRVAPFSTDVTGVTTNLTIDSQRRRLPERGS